MKYAEVIVDISSDKLDRSFTYRIPEHLLSEIRIGMVVTIPFGKGDRTRKGYVIGFSDHTEYQEDRIKEILELRTGEETTESKMMALAGWMKETCGCTMIQALKTVLPMQEKIKAKEHKSLSLCVSQEEGFRKLQELQNTRFHARTRLLAALLDDPNHRVDYTRAVKELGCSKSVVDYFEKQGIIRSDVTEELRSALSPEMYEREEAAVLTEDQQAAYEAILRESQKDEPRPILLHGITGSGKTQIYMQLIRDVLAQGKQAIVLIPEIALTYQTVRRFYGQFGEQVSVLNSRLSQGERYDQFRKAREGQVSIMVGPRSALFTPFPNLGLIIIDEEHEPAYKSESTPRYHARETAIYRGSQEHALVVLGSATPSLEAYYAAKQGKYCLVELAGRYRERALPQVSIVDLRQELREGNRSILSRTLAENLKECLDNKEQAMLFLNRRGYAGFISCRSCGYVVKCPHCDVSLAQHNHGRLICHYCGYETAEMEKCPECGSPYIGGFKAGTQQVEKVIQKMFPKTRVLRMDYDTTRTKGSYEGILSAFANHEADVLIGTQMIVKGHDFPKVTLVGVLAADLSLNESNYRCGERTYQLLTQAVGRAGRGERLGRAVIQTYHPDHYSIQAAAEQDYEKFYEEEMLFRTLMDYPPEAHMMAVMAAGGDEDLLGKGMHYLTEYVRRIYKKQDLGIIGPAKASVSKVKDIYHQVLYLKHPDEHVLHLIQEQLEKYIEINTGFRNLYIQFDYS
ncbi:MAG: primosomal protein N' [Eubacteriales bacterium]|nr:primosomal protein N' [Eubacteriales bacterium]